jgi:hypothetical protein
MPTMPPGRGGATLPSRVKQLTPLNSWALTIHCSGKGATRTQPSTAKKSSL